MVVLSIALVAVVALSAPGVVALSAARVAVVALASAVASFSAAAVPATLYYLALFTQVDLEAAKRGIEGLPPEQIPRIHGVLGLGWVFLFPLGFLVYALMIANWEAGKAGMAAVVLTFVVGLLRKETRPSLAAVLKSVEDTGRTLLDIVVITSLAGLVIGAWPAQPGTAEKSNRDALARLAPVRAALPAGVAAVSPQDFALFSGRAFDPDWVNGLI